MGCQILELVTHFVDQRCKNVSIMGCRILQLVTHFVDPQLL